MEIEENKFGENMGGPPRARQTSAKASSATRSRVQENLTNSHFNSRSHRSEYVRHFLQHAQRIRLRRQGDETAAQKKAQ